MSNLINVWTVGACIPGLLFWGYLGSKKLLSAIRGRRFAGVARPHKTVRRIVVSFGLVLIGCVVLLPAPKAHAWDSRLPTNYGALADYDWVKEMKNTYGVNINAGDYVMFNTTGFPYSTTANNEFLLAYAPAIKFTTDVQTGSGWPHSDGSTGYSSFCTTSGAFSGVYDVHDNTHTTTGSYSITTTSITGNVQGAGNYCFGLTTSGTNSNSVTGLAFTKATFASVYTGSPIPVHSLTVPKVSCSPLDIACWMGDLGDAIGATVDNVSKAILTGIAWLFAPDPGKTQASFDGVQSALSDKLGFLAYPFTFMADFFDAFVSSDTSCSTTSCSRDFGNFMGHDFSLNVSQIGVTMPSLWTWLLAAIRGLTVFGLIMAIRSKYLEVMQK